MSTTTMNLKQIQSSLAFPSSSRLLPSSQNTTSHPPIYLKLNASVLDVLAQSQSVPEITLAISDRNATLRIKDMEYQGAQYKEPGHVEVYLPDQGGREQSRFRSSGQISSRVLIKSDKYTKVSVGPERVDLSRPTESKIVQLLSLKPHSAKNLATKTQASLSFVNAVLSEIATASENDLFTLKKDFNLNKGPRKLAGSRENSLSPPPEQETKLENGTSANTTSASSGKKDIKRGVRRDAKREIKTDEPTKQNEPKPAASSNHILKRRSAASADSLKRIKKNDSTADMFELARKFQSTYGEYLELYSLLSKRESRPASQVQKLMAMHNQLAQWKKTLWSNSRSKSQVK